MVVKKNTKQRNKYIKYEIMNNMFAHINKTHIIVENVCTDRTLDILLDHHITQWWSIYFTQNKPQNAHQHIKLRFSHTMKKRF